MGSKHANSNNVVGRLSKIEGHIRGIKKMVENEKPCDEILIQFAAVQSALANAGRVLLEDHLEHCIIDKTKDVRLKEKLNQFKNALFKFTKGITQ